MHSNSNIFNKYSLSLPSSREVSFGELFTKIYHASSSTAPNVQTYLKYGVKYPHLHLPEEKYEFITPSDLLLTNNSRKSHSKSKSSFFILISRLKEFFSFLSVVFQFLLFILHIIAHHIPLLQLFFSARYPLEHEEIEIPSVISDWHSKLFLIALARQGSTFIYFYDFMKESFNKFSLKHELHKDIKQLAWRPNSESILAVVVKDGLLIWNIKEKSGYSNGVYEYIKVPGIQHISWHNNLIYVVSKYDHHIRVLEAKYSSKLIVSKPTFMEHLIDLFGGKILNSSIKSFSSKQKQQVTKQSYSVKYIPTFNGSLSHISFDRDFDKDEDAFCAVYSYYSQTLLIYSKQFKILQPWHLKGEIQSFVFAPNGYLLYVIKGSSSINVLQLRCSKLNNRIIGKYICSFDFSEYKLDDGRSCCGIIDKVIVHKERIVVSFKNRNHLAVLRTNFDCWNNFYQNTLPIGFIQGPASVTSVSSIDFFKKFAKGSLISVVWNTGDISFYPLYWE